MSKVRPKTKQNKQAVRDLSPEELPLQQNETAESLFGFDSAQAEAEENRRWEEQFASTPDDVFDKLISKVQADIKAGKVRPLNFKKR